MLFSGKYQIVVGENIHVQLVRQLTLSYMYIMQGANSYMYHKCTLLLTGSSGIPWKEATWSLCMYLTLRIMITFLGHVLVIFEWQVDWGTQTQSQKQGKVYQAHEQVKQQITSVRLIAMFNLMKASTCHIATMFFLTLKMAPQQWLLCTRAIWRHKCITSTL